MSTAWFNVSHLDLPVGEVFHPGEWGRTLSALLRTPERPLGVLDWEIGLEVARQLVGGQPSRANCVFVWENLALAERFRAEHRGNAITSIYTVEPIDANVPVFRGDYELISYGEAHTLANLGENALRYWRGNENGGPAMAELLVGGPVRIVGRALQGHAG